MKTLIAWSVALALAVGLGLLLRYRDGMVSIVLPPYKFDIAANTALLSLIVGFVVFYLVVRVGAQLIRAPGSFRQWRQKRHERQAHESLSAAVVAFNEGRYDQVEKAGSAALKAPATAGTATLLAARAAERRGDEDARDKWLHALQSFDSLKDARLMFIAECAVERSAASLALDSLDALNTKARQSAHAMRLRLRALELAGRWSDVLSVAAKCRQQGSLTEQAARVVRVNAYESLFEQAQGAPAEVEALYKSLSKEDRKDPQIAVAAAEGFAHSGREKRALGLIDDVLGERVEPTLLILFTRLGTIVHADKLAMAERWLVRHPDNPLVLATLGRLCLIEGLWGKAEAFLKRADELEPSPFTRLALAEMYDAIGQGAEATQLYRSLANEKKAAPRLASTEPGRVQAPDVAQSVVEAGALTDEPMSGSAPVLASNKHRPD
ncbi:MAG: heme biosynthesis HemY N-terminal domain-containing protein [Burkholderiaceae bacterium]